MVIFASVSFLAHTGRAMSAAARAQQWMKVHNVDPNDQAGLNDLKSSDPNAYAIVQALLAKRQLGLLDPKHPTANFAGAPKHAEDDQSALDVLRAAPTVEASVVPVSAVSVAEPVHHQYSSSAMWSFKAHTAQDDDNLVASVMGDVTGIVASPQAPVSTGSLISSSRSTGQSSALNGDMATFGFGGQNSMANAEAMAEQRPAQVAHASPRSSGFGMPSLEWGNRYAGTEQTQPTPDAAPVSASMSQQTSSLSSVAQPAPAVEPAPVQQVQASNPYLNGIDFSGDMPAKPQASMAQQKLRTHRAPTQAELANNPYLEGIDLPGVPAEQPRHEAPKPEASMTEKASYLDQIGFPMRPRRQNFQEQAPKSQTDNALTDFNWHGDDRDQIAARPRPETTMMQKVEEGVTQARISGPLTDWLSPSDSAPRMDAPKVITAQLQQPSEDAVDPQAMDKYNDWVRYNQ